MSVDYTLMIKKLQKLEQVYVLFAESTRLPFIECDPEDFDDQVYMYAEIGKASCRERVLRLV